ncbi:hypothetical protein WG66_008311 [Moniliophthora roreri]|nr:hypothetical protein WG66_008311 [Moniliophthora roreri]
MLACGNLSMGRISCCYQDIDRIHTGYLRFKIVLYIRTPPPGWLQGASTIGCSVTLPGRRFQSHTHYLRHVYHIPYAVESYVLNPPIYPTTNACSSNVMTSPSSSRTSVICQSQYLSFFTSDPEEGLNRVSDSMRTFNKCLVSEDVLRY